VIDGATGKPFEEISSLAARVEVSPGDAQPRPRKRLFDAQIQKPAKHEVAWKLLEERGFRKPENCHQQRCLQRPMMEDVHAVGASLLAEHIISNHRIGQSLGDRDVLLDRLVSHGHLAHPTRLTSKHISSQRRSSLCRSPVRSLHQSTRRRCEAVVRADHRDDAADANHGFAS
jgi:hypothetical protein